MIRFQLRTGFPCAFAFVTAVAVLGAVYLVARLQVEKAIEQRRAQTVDQLSTIRARLEGTINSNLFLTEGLAAYISTHGGISAEEFRSFARELIAQNPSIRNISLARDNIISDVHPLEGNEAMLGMAYLEQPTQRDAVLRAVASQRPVLAGPLELVQGGLGLINRTPVYLARGASAGQRGPYWGMVSTVFRAELVLGEVKALSEALGLRLAIRGVDGTGAEGELFFGSPRVFDDEPVKLEVTLPEGKWQLAAVPGAGWQPPWQSYSTLWLGGVLMAALLGTLMFFNLRTQQQIHHMALHDTLTGLPNRRLFDAHLSQAVSRANRLGAKVAVLQIDLDNFKPINDAFGHKAGDLVLVEIASRLRHALREADTVARMGGDEFTVLVGEISSREDAEEVARKIAASLSHPLLVNGKKTKVGASIGIALYPEDGREPGALTRKADHAMYLVKRRAKRAGESGGSEALQGASSEQRMGQAPLGAPVLQLGAIGKTGRKGH